jgi:hypothetical protein
MTAAKFESLIFSVWGLALSNVENIFMIQPLVSVNIQEYQVEVLSIWSA